MTRIKKKVEKKRFHVVLEGWAAPICGYEVDEKDFFFIICVGCLLLLRNIL